MTTPEQIMVTFRQQTYWIKRLPQEPIPITYQRLWKIIQHNPQNHVEFEKLVHLSQIWSYRHLFKCRYNPAIEQRLKTF